MLVVLFASAVIRVLVDATRGAIVYQDSAIYLNLSKEAPFSISPSRPSGYPTVLRLLRLFGDSLDVITAAQHLAGLVTGGLVYGLLVRFGARRAVATAATAIVVLDAHAVALEQDVLTETFFTLVMMVVAALVVVGPRRPGRVVASGLLLSAAVTMRTVGLFAVPVWLGYLLYRRVGRTVLAVGTLAVVLPVVAYCAHHAAKGKGFSLMDSDGWYLYAKVGPIVDCEGARIPAESRPLCVPPVTSDPNFYLYSPSSPAHRLFIGESRLDLEYGGMTHHNNKVLREFSMGIIMRHPLRFAGVVVVDFLRYFDDEPAPVELSLYGKPGTLLHWYERTVHVRGWLIGGLLLAGVVDALVRRDRRPIADGVFMLSLAGGLLLGTSATAAFNVRYLVPVVPLILTGAGLLSAPPSAHPAPSRAA